MTKERYQELNDLWNKSALYAIVDAYRSGGSEAVTDAILRLPQQYDANTFMGDKASAYQVLEETKSTYEKIVADNLRNLEEYTEYITKIESEDKPMYECVYMLDFLGSNMFGLLTE